MAADLHNLASFLQASHLNLRPNPTLSNPQASVPLQMRFRSLRTAHAVEVVPLLGVAPGVTPAGSDLLQYMLRLDLDCDRVSADWQSVPRQSGTRATACAAVRPCI